MGVTFLCFSAGVNHSESMSDVKSHLDPQTGGLDIIQGVGKFLDPDITVEGKL